MKTRFNTVDIRVAVSELRERYLGMRVANVYDIDNKTYIIKLAKPDEKVMILLESGNKIHSSQFDWPKNMFPSGFSMKLRKHLRTRRLESIEQLGVDRIVDLQFGSSEAAYHVILELYDRGNIVLTDHEYNILNILRPRADDSQDVRFAVNEKYPLELAKQKEPLMTMERLQAIIGAAKQGDNIKRLLIPHVCYGPPLIEHCLIGAGFSPNVSIGKGFNIEDDLPKLMSALIEAEEIFNSLDKCKGYIIQKREKKPKAKEGEDQELLTYEDFCPLHFRQHQNLPFIEVDTFNKAIDEFFSKHESQKFDMQALQQEKSALKKLENVKKDHEKRLTQLQNEQEEDKKKAQMIEMNLTLVDRAILVVQSALANQIDWTEIQTIVKEAQLQGDPVASAIKGLKLDINHITMLLGFPYSGLDSDDEDEMKPMKVDIDLSISAYGNARRYFDMKRTAAKKEQKTVDASSKALKSAERKTKETLKEVATKVSIQKLRKVHWFEKFLWFISSENFLVIAGRDQQQNEMIYKRYLRPGDIYVHADLHGASSLVIKNHTKDPVPPKTLNEAGTMATCNSAAWDAKVVTSAWWVYHNQVSKTAPTGEYLTTGSFMVRGKKNYLPPSHLVYGFGVLFKVDDTSVFRHKGERQVRMAEEDKMSVTDSLASESEASESVDLDISDSDSDSETASVCSKSNNDPFGENTENRTKDETADDAIANIMKDEPGLSTSVDGLVLQDVEEVKGVADKPDGAEHEVDSVQVNEEESEAQQKVVNAGSSVDNENVDEKSEFLFPDTTISLAHVGGDKYGLQRALSSSSYEEPEPEEKNEIHIQSKDRLTAKQRRELKKKKKTNQSTDDQTPASIQQDSQQAASKGIAAVPKEKVEKQPTQQQAKRGQKAKMKKIKEKYGDQDEDERTLKMEILASAGPQKEDKKKKGKKEKAQQQQQQQKQKQMMLQKKKAAMAPLGKEGVILSEDSVIRSGEGKEIVPKESHKVEDDGNLSDEEKQAVLEDENVTLVEDADVFDSLTGIPNPEDELLYAIPYSAPYSMLLNFKYKVKLTPGSTKRGKAAKTALHMFMFDRTATQREKDLLKSIKDSDMARNLPGKVKVSAPNLQKAKGKK